MSEFMTNFHFLRPLWLLLLLLPIVGYKQLFQGLKTSSAWEGVCDKNLLNYLLVKGSSKQRSAIMYLCLSSFIAAVVAISGPTWQKKDIPAYMPENPVMVLLNLSSDMEEADITPNRLSRAKYNISDLLDSIGNTQVGLVVYTNEPFLISPFTEDNRILKNLLQVINTDIMPENGDRLNRAIDLAVEKLKGSNFTKGNIVVFAADVGQDFNASLYSSKKATAQGFDVSVVEINSNNNEKLKMIADNGNGLYLKNSSNINQIANFINEGQSQALSETKNNQEIWLDFGYYLVIIPLIGCLYLFRKGVLVIAFIVAFANQANAGFFLNNNQEGLKAFKKGDYVTASEKFEDFTWKASAFYKIGDYKTALRYFSKSNDITSMYNQGNALAKGGKIKEAIKKYEEVLEIDPNHEDAKFNLEYLKQEQEKNQNQNGENDQQNDQDQDQDQDQETQNSGAEQQDNQNSSDSKDQESENQSASGNNEQKEDENGQQKNEQPQTDNNQEGEADSNQEQQTQTPTIDENVNNSETEPKIENNKENPPPEYDEETQARVQQYRDIPEDVGGLLREFIKKEYTKKRYKDR